MFDFLIVYLIKMNLAIERIWFPVQSQADILFCLFPLLLHQMPQPKASSGHKLIFTEDESILLTDKNGNVIKLDTQGKNIEISAPETAGKAKRSDIWGICLCM